jgi:hypothetical protein
MRSGEEHPRFLSYPDGSNKQVNRALEERRMVTFDPVTQEQERPTAKEESAAGKPSGEKKQDQPGKNHRDANSMQQLVPAGRVFVIVLRHVVRQTQSAPPCGDDTADKALYTELQEIARVRRWRRAAPNRRLRPEQRLPCWRRVSMAEQEARSGAQGRQFRYEARRRLLLRCDCARGEFPR